MRVVKKHPIAKVNTDFSFLYPTEELVVDREKTVAEVTAAADGVSVRCVGKLKPDEADALAVMLTRASALVRNRGSDAVGDGDVTFHEQAEQEAAVADGQDGVAVDTPSVVHQVDEGGVR